MENSIEKNLQLLLELQEIDNQIIEILQLQGELPQEIKKLDNELAHLASQIKAYDDEITNLEESIKNLRVKKKDLEVLVKRYEEQQATVRNNREYDAITKEIELHQLDIQLIEKKVREYYEKIDQNKKSILDLNKIIEKVTNNLKIKQEDLHLIMQGSQEQKEKLDLDQKKQKIQSSLDQPLLKMYEEIRDYVLNKRAVVMIKDGACGGCFTIIYPQLQALIKEKRQILKCEHCGRILADVADATIITAVTTGEETPIEYV